MNDFNIFLFHRHTQSIILEIFNTSLFNFQFYKEVLKLKRILHKSNPYCYELVNFCEERYIYDKVYKRLKYYIQLPKSQKIFIKYFQLAFFINSDSKLLKLKLYLFKYLFMFFIYFC